MVRIFLSYRRADSQIITERIYDYLEGEFGAENIFKDVNDIGYGEDFRRVVQDEIGRSDVLLVIIGPQWATIQDENGNRRLDAKDDPVRIEVETGLLRGEELLIIPVLVQGAKIPDKKDLPHELERLNVLNAANIRNDPDFRGDMQRLINTIKRREETLTRGQVRPTPPPKDREKWLIGGAVLAIVIAAVLLLFSSQSNTPEPTPNATTEAPAVALASASDTHTPSPTDAPTHTHTPSPTNTLRAAIPANRPTTTPCAVIAIEDATRVHAGPGRNRSVVRYLREGQTYTVVGTSSDSDGATWWAIVYPNITSAWVMRSDVSAQGDCSAYEATLTPTVSSETCFLIATTDDVGIHTGPGRNRSVLGLLREGQPYIVIGRGQDTDEALWWSIEPPNPRWTSAWVMRSDISAQGDCSAYEATPTPTPATDVCIISANADGVRVHTGPGRNRSVVRYLRAGNEYQTIAKATAEGMTWYQINYSGLAAAWVAQEDVNTRGACD